MFIHIWKMRARKKRVEDYEKFGRQVTLPFLKKVEGCLGAHFIKTFESRKPEYWWLVFWRDHKALEQARADPLWRDQIKRFEAGNFYKSIPLELVCEELESFSVASAKSKRATNPEKSENRVPAGELHRDESVETEAVPSAAIGPAAEEE